MVTVVRITPLNPKPLNPKSLNPKPSKNNNSSFTRLQLVIWDPDFSRLSILNLILEHASYTSSHIRV